MKTIMVREIKIVKGQAFYRFVDSRSPVWDSMNYKCAIKAIRNGKGTWVGITGPAVFNKGQSDELFSLPSEDHTKEAGNIGRSEREDSSHS